MTSTWITPSLAVAPDWVADAVFDDAHDAAKHIRDGGTAYVDSEATAVAVLYDFGLDDAEVADRLHFARTGQVL